MTASSNPGGDGDNVLTDGISAKNCVGHYKVLSFKQIIFFPAGMLMSVVLLVTKPVLSLLVTVFKGANPNCTTLFG